MISKPLKFFYWSSFSHYPRAWIGSRLCSMRPVSNHFSSFVFLCCYWLQCCTHLLSLPTTKYDSIFLVVASHSSCWYSFLPLLLTYLIVLLSTYVVATSFFIDSYSNIKKRYFIGEICVSCDVFFTELRVSQNLLYGSLNTFTKFEKL